MSDTIVQDCIKCGHETDCIEGVCQECALRETDYEKEISQLKRQREKLLKALKNLLEVDLLKDEYHIVGRQAIAEAEGSN